ncbi:unnamed protein product [Paramecium pentaurelia]|uniref:EML-like second beta-propeller domain-containing protein n=1 Tax=Paramecium pentaurelia TaxID=43138 RepID=A0A8S1YM16_9CILI|nr:unnamed protein product [Paramecium pentaurelia]
MNDSNEQKEDLVQIFTQVKDVDDQIYCQIIEKLRKQNVLSCLGYLSDTENQNYLEEYFQKGQNSTQEENEFTQRFGRNNIKQIFYVIQKIENHDFNKYDYTEEWYLEQRQVLINRINDQKQIIGFLKFLVHLTALNDNLIQCGSNSLNLLAQMKVDLRNQNFENIRIKNTSLVGANFVRCNLSGSELDNVDISGVNLNEALLFNCKWKNLKIFELYKLEGHTGDVKSVCVSSDGSTLASGSQDKSIRLWDVKTGQQKAKLDAHSSGVNSVCFSPDCSLLASGSQDKSVFLWDVKTRKKVAKMNSHKDGILSVCFSPDGSLLASGSQDKSIILWDVKTRKKIAKIISHKDGILSVCFSPDGSLLASGSIDNSIVLMNVKTGQQQMCKMVDHRDYARSICFSPDGTLLASGSYDKSIRLWDVKTGEQKGRLDGHSSTINSVCFSPDGTTIASGSYDKSICLWDVKTGQKKAKFDGHDDCVNSVCFFCDGTILASGSYDKSIRLWDVKTEQYKAKFDGHSDSVLSVSFSPDGTTLASGGGNISFFSSIRDNSIRLWDVKTGQEKVKLDGHSSTVNTVCFSPDGTTLASTIIKKPYFNNHQYKYFINIIVSSFLSIGRFNLEK